MDAYHHIFFQTIQDLAKTLDQLTPAAVEERIMFLVNYAAMHFESEERLMEASAYPEFEAHRRLHAAFTERLAALQQAYHATPSAAIAHSLLELSQEWLGDHILREDMKYKTYVQP